MGEPRYRRSPLRSEPPSRQDGPMPGALLIVIVLVVAIPVGVLVSGAIGSALLGYALKTDVDKSNEGSELLETNY